MEYYALSLICDIFAIRFGNARVRIGPEGICLFRKIDLFTVVCLVTWPLHQSEAGVDLVMIQTSPFSYVNDVVVMLISKNLHKKRSEVSNKTRSTPASLSFIGHVAKHTLLIKTP